MVAAGFLPVCYHKGKLLFLFGLEGPMEKSAKGWSDFAGGLNSNEKNGNDRDIYKAALREMSEETSGFLGGPKEIDQLVKKNGGFCKYVSEFSSDNKKKKSKYHIHIFRLDYDEKLVEYYNNSHKFLYDVLDHKMMASTSVFEKIEIQWFSIDEMKKKRASFRFFYREIVDQLIYHEAEIGNFVKETLKKNI